MSVLPGRSAAGPRGRAVRWPTVIGQVGAFWIVVVAFLWSYQYVPALAQASYAAIERPFLRRKDRFRAGPPLQMDWQKDRFISGRAEHAVVPASSQCFAMSGFRYGRTCSRGRTVPTGGSGVAGPNTILPYVRRLALQERWRAAQPTPRRRS